MICNSFLVAADGDRNNEPMNAINQIIRLKKFATQWGVEFSFTSKQVCFYLPERSASLIKDAFLAELADEVGWEIESSDDGLAHSVNLA
jgi:hypothetical protein